jgi:hypothetical protein
MDERFTRWEGVLNSVFDAASHMTYYPPVIYKTLPEVESLNCGASHSAVNKTISLIVW